jgi:asparagine synthase (glutamine-hydrolysing)
MGGMVGQARFDGAGADRTVLAHMSNALAHRGPDDAGLLVEGSVGLGFRRLAILDLASGRQPMTRGRVTLVCDGRIFNYLELRQELALAGYRFETQSDKEVILALWEAEGPACLQRLNGMFALVIWDRDRDILFAARDRLGIKPLYWWADEGQIVFASEIKALLRHPAIPATADFQSLSDYLTFQCVLGDGTLFRGIHKLLPAHALVVQLDTGRRRMMRYWEPRWEADGGRAEESFVATLRELVTDAVRLQLRSDVPVATYLSGGLDSSLITTLAARERGASLTAFHAAFDAGPEWDELPQARLVAQGAGIALAEVGATPQEFAEALPRFVRHFDEPAGAPAAFPRYLIAGRAAQRVRVVLGGLGGDEVFGGYPCYLASVDRLWQEGLFTPIDRRYFRLVARGADLGRLLSPDLRRLVNPEAAFERFQAHFNVPGTSSVCERMSRFDLGVGLPALLDSEDRVSMAHGLESRMPLLDHRIIELVASMPRALKSKGGELKAILRRALGDLLPPEIRGPKPKMGFPVPPRLWYDGPVGEFARSALQGRAARGRGLFDHAAVGELIEQEPPFGRELWSLLSLEIWFQEFIDRPARMLSRAPDAYPVRAQPRPVRPLTV